MFYKGAQSTKLVAIMLLMKFVDELLSLLHMHLLHRDNSLPSNMYQAKAFIRKVGLGY